MSEAGAAPAASAAGKANGHSATMPFGQYERMLAVRYLFATRKDGGVALMSVIAFVGVALAVMALIAVMSIMNGFRHELLTRLLGIDGHIYVQAEMLTLDDAAAVSDLLRDMPGVSAAFPVIIGEALATGPNNQATLAVVRGMDPADVAGVSFIRDSLILGGDEEFGEGLNGGDLIYAGAGLAQTLGAGIDDAITLIVPRGAQTVYGNSPIRKAYYVADFVDVGLDDYNRVLVYMPLQQASLFLSRQDRADHVEVRLADPDAVETMRPVIQRALGAYYIVSDWRDRRASLFNALQVERSAMRLILMLVVVIAALNIISGFTMLVRNKARDIAILRTVGVQRGSVLRVFLMSGAMLGAAGTLAGLALGVLFCTFIGPIQNFLEVVLRVELFAADVYGLDHLPVLLEWGEVAIISAWGFAVSVLVTLIPAWFAAKLDPVEALRYE